MSPDATNPAPARSAGTSCSAAWTSWTTRAGSAANTARPATPWPACAGGSSSRRDGGDAPGPSPQGEGEESGPGSRSVPPPPANPHYLLGRPYQIGGTWWYPRENQSLDETG